VSMRNAIYPILTPKGISTPTFDKKRIGWRRTQCCAIGSRVCSILNGSQNEGQGDEAKHQGFSTCFSGAVRFVPIMFNHSLKDG